MSAIANWYHNHYAIWSRSRRAQVTPFLARAEENARLGRAPTEAVIINMGELLVDDPNAKPKKQETLFGPALGTVNGGPAWASSKTTEADDLTPETVKSWVAKSKDPAQPTTTLQALVNLKRPSLRLSPLAPADPSEEHAAPAQHGLEFDFDCDAPKCKISVHVLECDPSGPLLVFESIVEGGFAKTLRLDDGATLELAKFEHKLTPENPKATTPSADPNPSASTGNLNADAHARASRKRFSAFPFRRRQHHVAGPALRVVDAEPVAPTAETENSDKAEEKDEGGVKVIIRLTALDENDKTLTSPNSQATYLHIVRVGAAPENTPEEDTRPWVVKVVKREATIGLHTFHLHEIYGLSTSTTPHQSASYPPPSAEEAQEQALAYDFAGTECVLCLSEPREVVLLPCRHLVACKECAINMIEFGAGGSLTHASEDAAAPATPATPVVGEGAVAPGATPGETAAAAAPAVGPTPPTRRKRKAKGWFCPVCRQPYTSLLRISTTPPDVKSVDTPDEKDEEDVMPANAPVAPAPAWTKPSFLRSFSISSGRNAAAPTATVSPAATALTNGTTPSSPPAAALATVTTPPAPVAAPEPERPSGAAGQDSSEPVERNAPPSDATVPPAVSETTSNNPSSENPSAPVDHVPQSVSNPTTTNTSTSL